MGLLKGNKLSGLIGPLVVRDSGKKGVSIVQTAPRLVNQSRGTKLSGKLLGLASSLAGTIRLGLTYLINKDYDPDMINRFYTPVRAVIKQCFDQDTATFEFKEDSFQRLVGFEFNAKSLLIDSLLVYPQVSLEDGTMKIIIPEFEVPTQLKFPFGTNLCHLSVVVTQVVLDQALHQKMPSQSMEIDINQGTVPAASFSFEVSPGSFCVAGIGLKYFSINNGVSTPKNSKTFNPANICAAVITEGEFVAPTNPDANGRWDNSWKLIDKLNMMRPPTSS